MGKSVIGFYQFLSGAAMLGAAAVGLYFIKFWVRTHERLFLLFGIAFWIMSLERLVLVFINDGGREDHSLVYLIRLAAFLLILFAIADKNRKENEGSK